MARPAPKPATAARTDAHYMRLALRLASRGKGKTSPNPPVGAVVVREGRIVGRGYHAQAGLPHAEVEALMAAGRAARGATLYVTLEPCNHHGLTPPCTELILAARLSRVVFGQADPNPGVRGGGGVRLAAAGVEIGRVLEADCSRFNEAWTKWVTTGLPFGVLKAAASLDGRIAAVGGDSKWISCQASRRLAHRLRAEHDAVLVGIGTALADDPQLTCRLLRGRNPLRVVVDSRLRLPPTARMLSCPGQTLVACLADAPQAARDGLRAAGAELVELPADAAGRVDLRALLAELGRRGLCSVLIEGGAEINAAALAAGLVDKLLIFLAPRLIGGQRSVALIGGQGVARVAEGLPLRFERVRRVGGDLLIEAYPA